MERAGMRPMPFFKVGSFQTSPKPMLGVSVVLQCGSAIIQQDRLDRYYLKGGSDEIRRGWRRGKSECFSVSCEQDLE